MRGCEHREIYQWIAIWVVFSLLKYTIKLNGQFKREFNLILTAFFKFSSKSFNFFTHFNGILRINFTFYNCQNFNSQKSRSVDDHANLI